MRAELLKCVTEGLFVFAARYARTEGVSRLSHIPRQAGPVRRDEIIGINNRMDFLSGVYLGMRRGDKSKTDT